MSEAPTDFRPDPAASPSAASGVAAANRQSPGRTRGPWRCRSRPGTAAVARPRPRIRRAARRRRGSRRPRPRRQRTCRQDGNADRGRQAARCGTAGRRWPGSRAGRIEEAVHDLSRFQPCGEVARACRSENRTALPSRRSEPYGVPGRQLREWRSSLRSPKVGRVEPEQPEPIR